MALLCTDSREAKIRKAVEPVPFDFGFDSISAAVRVHGTEPPEDFPLDLEPGGAASRGYFDGPWDSLPESEKYSVYVALWDSAVSRVLALQEEFAKSL